jgi:hypothetical protein
MQLSKRFVVTLKVLPTAIWLLVCLNGGAKSDSFDLPDNATTTDIDDTIDLQINALGALAVLAYLAQMQSKSGDVRQMPAPLRPADCGDRREVGEPIAVAAEPPPSPIISDRQPV